MNEPLSLGAANDDEEDLLRKFLSPALKGKGWDALIAGLATGDKYRNDLAPAAFDQFFKSTASGVYLDRRASNDGLSRPTNIGISDDVFRKLAIKTTARKQVVEVILESLETFYGSEATRAYSVSGAAEPYNLQIGDTLAIQTDNGQIYNIPFQQHDFGTMSAALALEVSVVITRELIKQGSTAYSVAFADPEQGTTVVRIFSGALGLRGSVRILGGRAQNALKFPTLVHPTVGDGPQPTTQFTITAGTGLNGVQAGRVRFTYLAGTTADLLKVNIGDYVNIYGGVFAVQFRSTYSVVATDPTYFEISDNKLTWPGSVTLSSADDVRFYRPTTSTVQSTGRLATAIQGDPKRLDVILPTTTQAVARTKNTAAYLHAADSINISSATRNVAGLVTVNTATAHGLETGDFAFIDGLYPTLNSVSGLGWAAADVGNHSLPYEDSAALKLSDGRILQCGGEALTGPVVHAEAVIGDPTTNVWSSIAAMSLTRFGHTITMLQSGKILVVGGETVSKVCELYDLATNTWTNTGSTVGTHQYHTATLLNDGTVLVVGGGSSSELYNPTTGLFTVLAHQPAVSRTRHTSNKLKDGRVLVAGGTSSSNTAEVYNTVTQLWTTTGNMNASRYDHRSILLPVGTSGNVLLIGGYNGTTYLSSSEYFNPATMAFEVITSTMSIPRSQTAVAVRADGKVIVAGGLTTGDSGTNTADLFDPVTSIWSAISGTFSARASALAFDVPDGRDIVVGGNGAFAVANKYTGAVVNSGILNGLVQVTVTGGSALTYETSDAMAVTTCGAVGTVTPYETPTNGIQGPFIYDEQKGLAITGVETALTTEIVRGNSYTVVGVTNASSFPDAEGFLVFGFGTDLSLAPIRYLGRVSSNSLLLDPTFVFPATLPVNTAVTLLKQRGAWSPDHPEQVGTFYVTAAAAGRVAASNAIDNLVAAGVEVVKTVVYPNDVGLGNAGLPVEGTPKIADKVAIWGGDDVDDEVKAAREE